MGPISLDIVIDAPRDRVFDAICDLSRRPSWTDHFVSGYRLQRIDGSGEGAGARFRAGAPGVRYMDTTIVSAERPHTIVERGRGGRADATSVVTRWELSGSEGHPTELTLTFATEPGSVGARLMEARAAGWWRRRWRRALRRLAAQVEEDAGAAEAIGVGGMDRHPGAVH